MLLVVAVVNVACGQQEKSIPKIDDEGFVSIFNGSSLEGWKVLPPESAAAWTIENGMIVGNGDQGKSYLVFENHEIADL
jgi:hypothetical protein